MFLNRGMMEAAKTEGEMAGVMGHEISHVALRHGRPRQPSPHRGRLGRWLVRSLAGSSAVDGAT